MTTTTTQGEKQPSDEEILKELHNDNTWNSWKCRCGCLNRRDNGNCGRCHGMKTTYATYYGANGDVNMNEIINRIL